MSSSALKIVAMDDDEMILELMTHSLKKAGHNTIGFSDSDALLEYIEGHKDEEPDVIILDKVMPDELSGVDILKHLKRDHYWQNVPVIVQSGEVGLEYMQESIDAGAYYYLTKPYEQEAMVSLVKAAARESVNRKTIQNNLHTNDEALKFLKQAVFKVFSPDEGRKVTALIAAQAKQQKEVSLVLSELILNAIEHGNLNIGYDRKAELLELGQLDNEVERLLSASENSAKRVHISYARSASHIKVRVRDEGDGFDWEQFLNINPTRFVDLNGRGIAYAKIVGLDLEYSNGGNTVEVTFDAKELTR